jgi:hypothetical protein
MDNAAALKLALDPAAILRAQGLEPDAWQIEFLLSSAPSILLNCCRGAGKSRATSAKAVHHAIFTPRSLTLLVSRSQRQALELFRYCKQAFRALGWPVPYVKETETQIELENGSRIVSLPGKEANIRSFQGVTLLILDEAARIPDDLFASVSPMTAIAHGQQILLSTPFGKRGFFYREWHDERNTATRFRVPWQRCPRHTKEFIEEERRKFGDPWVEQEYECSFMSMEGLVYPDFSQCLVDIWPVVTFSKNTRWLGGIDWGWNNPFAALWGALDHDDVLWIGWERYARQTSLAEHVATIEATARKQPLCPSIPRILWYADPSGPTEIAECRRHDWKVLRGNNDIRLGISAVTARIRTGRLKVLRNHCPNLIAEAQLYRYPSPAERAIQGEDPIDSDNHALGALRYLIATLDRRQLRHLARDPGSDRPTPIAETAAAVHDARPQAQWLRLDNPALWNPL